MEDPSVFLFSFVCRNDLKATQVPRGPGMSSRSQKERVKTDRTSPSLQKIKAIPELRKTLELAVGFNTINKNKFCATDQHTKK